MRKYTLIETLLVFGLIMAYIWKLRFLYFDSWVVIPALMLGSHFLRRENAQSLGFKLGGLWMRLKQLGPALIGIAFSLLAGGFLFHTLRPLGWKGMMLGLGAYLLWGLAQQWALNAYFLNRFGTFLSKKSASIFAAALFCLVHAPNIFLMSVTLPFAWVATQIYQRHRNLYILGIAHAVIGMLLFIVVPDSISHHLRVGPGYFKW